MIETPLGTVSFNGAPECTRDGDVWTVVWRRAGPAPEHEFWLRLDPEGATGGASGGAATGEWLDAMTFDRDGTFVSFGGPDIEWLHGRAGRDLPARWASLLPSDTAAAGRYRVDLGDTTVTWHLPDLLAGESLSLRVAVAWSTDEMTSWSAVDAAVLFG